jgi:hypothetical protein
MLKSFGSLLALGCALGALCTAGLGHASNDAAISISASTPQAATASTVDVATGRREVQFTLGYNGVWVDSNIVNVLSPPSLASTTYTMYLAIRCAPWLGAPPVYTAIQTDTQVFSTNSDGDLFFVTCPLGQSLTYATSRAHIR